MIWLNNIECDVVFGTGISVGLTHQALGLIDITDTENTTAKTA